jgi:hypothetical protein
MSELVGSSVEHESIGQTQRVVQSWFRGDDDWIEITAPGLVLTVIRDPDVGMSRVFCELRRSDSPVLIWRATFYYGAATPRFGTFSGRALEKDALEVCSSAIYGLFGMFHIHRGL